MAFEEQPDFARQVADLNKYGQALNRCETVEEVVSLTLEAMSLLFQFSYSTFVEVRDGDPHVVHSTNPRTTAGDQPSDVAARALAAGETVVATGEEAGMTADSEVTATLAVPTQVGGEVTAILVTRSTSVDSFGEEQTRPLEILASHAGTAISNIRSRERLERARQDLETRKEMIEMYDRLLRHDLGNDLQVIAGFADAVAADVDGQTEEYVGKIQRAARSSADLIERVGDLVSTLEAQDEPEPRDLGAILRRTVTEVAGNYDSLSVDFDPDEFDHRVYGGELLDSVFTNLVSNAAVHNEGDVEVRVYTEELGTEEVVVGFADDGDGVPERLREEIFEMGAKGPDSSGSGFGLGFVRALTESYGGSVSVGDSELGGADFRVTLQRV
ncbi:GAF domain-containing protein [Halomicroarcula sp. F13]|uniref:histidine kinase n=1 Tax=Haloarcula rubra TaxID=2487747 RepID=A0AAW4PQE0_9EURY|nr:ATP-binding protein [Halomicroarcula rubra]MBX0323456.1 GAF domain-containing protein [Halomicroarcula rubra]